jgi:hypothetical protein
VQNERVGDCDGRYGSVQKVQDAGSVQKVQDTGSVQKVQDAGSVPNERRDYDGR